MVKTQLMQHYNRRPSPQSRQIHYSPNLLNTIENAIDNTRLAVLEYDSSEKGITIREIEPMAVVHKDGKKNLVGWCRLRNDYRPFRLDRILTIKLMNEEFTPRADFNLSEYQDSASAHSAEQLEEEEN